MISVPLGSIYYWMYEMGLKHADLAEVEHAVWAAGKSIRQKDYDNYRSGWLNSDRSEYGSTLLIPPPPPSPSKEFLIRRWDEYPVHPYLGLPEIDCRWVPIGSNGKPLIKWSNGCMYRWDAEKVPGMVSLAENLRGCQFIVIDIDGDHDDELAMDTIEFGWKWHSLSHALDKRKVIAEYDGGDPMDFRPASFHLTFKVDRVIPTMHFPGARIDIIGNRSNSLRYLKDKVWNGLQPLTMDATIWTELQQFIGSHDERR